MKCALFFAVLVFLTAPAFAESPAPLSLPDRRAAYHAAAQDYQRRFDAGDLSVARDLGQLYEMGRGVPQDSRRALTYYYIAQRSGRTDAAPFISAMESSLGPGAVAAARQDADRIFADSSSPVTVPPKKSKNGLRHSGIVKTIASMDDNQDLGTRDDTPDLGLAFDARGSVTYIPAHSDLRLHAQARLYQSTGIADTRSDDGNDSRSKAFAELRQFWIEFNKLFGAPALSVTAGRQRIREERGLWWNNDIDALRVDYITPTLSAFLAAGNSFDNYRIGEDDAFRADHKDRLRLLGEIAHVPFAGHRIEGRFLYEHDHSGHDRAGDIINADDLDREDSDLLWMGLRGIGERPVGNARLFYRLDGIVVTGEERLSDSAAGPGGGLYTVTGTRTRDVMGWAVDGNVDLALPDVFLSPTFTLGYAFASGDDHQRGTGTDSAFRQTGMQGNTSPFSGETAMGRLRHYGEVLRPELSNLHIVRLGAHVPVMDGGAFSLSYFSYWMDEKTGALRTAGITAPTTGAGSHIGQAADAALYIPVMDNVATRFIVGGFKAGDAYGPGAGEQAWRGTAELRIRF